MAGKMLCERDLEEIRRHYDEKNEVLVAFGEQVSSAELYEDIFDDLDEVMPVVMIDEDEQKHIVKMSINEAMEQCENRNDVLLGGCTYFHNWISKKSAKDIRAFIIDMDNVYSGVLQNALRADWATANGDPLPIPTYIVNSGTGLHLYFVLDEPIPHYNCNAHNIDVLYRNLAIGQTTRRVYLQKQVQWFGQDFRMAGGLNKYDWANTVFKIGDKWDIDKLGQACGLQGVHFIRSDEKRSRAPKKHDGAPKQKRQGWHSNAAFYEYALKNCREKTKEGNRYMSMCALTAIAWKCNVPVEKVRQDLLGLLPGYNENAKRLVKPKEIDSALKMYNPAAMLTPRCRLEDWQGWEYKPIKRNGRKREVHLQIARAVRDILHPEGWGNTAGKPRKIDIVKAWRAEHPEGKKADCIRETGLSKPTVYRWWEG